VFAVAAEAEQGGDDELRTVAGPGAIHRVADHFEAGGQIRAVHRIRFNAVARAPVGQVGAGELAAVRGGVGVLVVGHDEDEREFFDGGLVQRLVKRAGGGRPVAEARGADAAGNAFHPAGKKDPVHDGYHRAEVADHRQQPGLRAAAVDVAVAPAHGAERGAEVGADGVNHRFAEREPAGTVADERGEHVGFFQRNPDGALKASWPRPRKTPPLILPAR
jgi:hypothetical protein